MRTGNEGSPLREGSERVRQNPLPATFACAAATSRIVARVARVSRARIATKRGEGVNAEVSHQTGNGASETRFPRL